MYIIITAGDQAHILWTTMYSGKNVFIVKILKFESEDSWKIGKNIVALNDHPFNWMPYSKFVLGPTRGNIQSLPYGHFELNQKY